MSELLVDKELQLLKKTVQSLIKESVAPAELSPGEYVKKLPEEVVSRLQTEAKSSGLQALGAKKEWGGAGLSVLARAILLEEASQHRLGLYHPAVDAFGGEFPRFLEECTNEQIEWLVKPAIKEGKGCFIALWEEHEDNYLEKLTSSAVRSGNEWILNGKKTYIQNLEQSAFGVVLVNCILENGENQPTLFLLELDDQLEKEETVLIDVQTTHSISLKNYRVNDNQRIGAVGEGTDLMKQWLAEAQILLGAKSIGVAAKAIEYGKQFAKMRITRGKPLAEFPSIRSMLGKAVINLQSARLMVQDAARKSDTQESDFELAAQMAKLHATETTAKIIDDVLQIHGGTGYAGDLPIERWFKELRIARVNLQKAETIIENVARTILG
ncbi:acyl-CoA dehydrogenase family protein [Neobacillus drentensis]|uniref:acyl-CoA dehydrogenase family protein n=1 Tax=Neobacillus drentensis TaxID=220684 RepID=UPI0008241764|nr:acyl-CoA dehydrogenase family protein [Neobacillus drentensis]